MNLITFPRPTLYSFRIDKYFYFLLYVKNKFPLLNMVRLHKKHVSSGMFNNYHSLCQNTYTVELYPAILF